MVQRQEVTYSPNTAQGSRAPPGLGECHEGRRTKPHLRGDGWQLDFGSPLAEAKREIWPAAHMHWLRGSGAARRAGRAIP